MTLGFKLLLMYALWAHWSGWTLTLCRNLSRSGYALAAVPLAVVLVAVLRSHRASDESTGTDAPGLAPTLLPTAFYTLAGFALIGGLLYPPGLYDFHAYRFPRMLAWLTERHWHWIPEANRRMNVMGVGQEWMLLPLLTLTRSSRAFFLINLSAFLLLPGLLRTLLIELGVARTAASRWMWLLPMAFGYILQAASASNDLLGSVFVLGAAAAALRFARLHRSSDLIGAIAAMAVATGIKPTNAPLALPVLCALLAAGWRPLSRRWKQAAASVLAALPASYAALLVAQKRTAPTAGDGLGSFVSLSPTRLATGLLNTLWAALTPPANPLAGPLNRGVLPSLQALGRAGDVRIAPPFVELVTEDAAGLGLGVTVALLAWVWMARRAEFGQRMLSDRMPDRRQLRCFWVAVACVTLFLLTGIRAGSTGRVLLPYYPFGLAALLRLAPGTAARPGSRTMVRWSEWFCIAMAALTLVLNPSRPLWPALTLSAPGSAASRLAPLRRLHEAYSVYRNRPTALRPIHDALRPDDRVILFLGTGDDITTALWRPYGQRQVRWIPHSVLAEPSALQAAIASADALVANVSVLRVLVGDTDEWASATAGIAGHTNVQARMKLSDDRTEWIVARLGSREFGSRRDTE